MRARRGRGPGLGNRYRLHAVDWDAEFAKGERPSDLADRLGCSIALVLHYQANPDKRKPMDTNPPDPLDSLLDDQIELEHENWRLP